MKKLRYASEFMATAYEGTLDAMIERTVEIQDCLGSSRTPFSPGNSSRFARDWKGKLVDPDLLFILGEIYQLQSEIARERRERSTKSGSRFLPKKA